MNERDVFLAAIEIPIVADRIAYLDRVCAGNGELRAQVDALLRADADPRSFLDEPILGRLVTPSDTDAIPNPTPEVPVAPGKSPVPGVEATQRFSLHDPDGRIAGFLAPSTAPGSLGRLGHYEVQQVLGSGGFGTVLRAFDDVLHRMVAIKLMAPELAATSPARKRFLREARASAAVRHENIVNIYSVEEEPLPYLVMEFIPGQTLEQKLNCNGPLEVPEVLRLGQQIASGLAAAHATGLIHRDIKPANILLEAGTEERVKITDFGLARAADDATITQSGVIAGTPMYMAPEQAHGHPLDQRADLFSLGSVLYQMISGRPPFRAETTLAVLKRVTEDTPRPIRDIIPETPAWLCAIITKLHAKQPNDRFQTAKELADLLGQCRKAVENGTEPKLPWQIPIAAPTIDHEPAKIAGVLRDPNPLAANKVATSPPDRNTSGYGVHRLLSRKSAIIAGGTAFLFLCGAIIIALTNKDGGQTKIEVLDTSNVAITNDPASGGRKPPDSSPTGKSKQESGGLHPPLAGTGWHGWPADAPPPAIAPFDAAQAKQHQETWAKYLKVPVEYTNTIGMKFRLIPPGEFLMGSTPAEIEAALKTMPEDAMIARGDVMSEGPQHKVILTKAIYVGVHEVTQQQYVAVMKANPSAFSATGDQADKKKLFADVDSAHHPVDSIFWTMAATYCEKLSGDEGLSSFYTVKEGAVTWGHGTGYRLPTEAEWEFACRAGTTSKYWSGDDSAVLARADWSGSNSGAHTHPVGELQANPFGLFDLHGNVSEWCHDKWYHDYYRRFQDKTAVDPWGPDDPEADYVQRGGSWYAVDTGYWFRSAARSTWGKQRQQWPFHTGMRLVVSVDAVKKALQDQEAKSANSAAGWHGWPKDAPPPAIAPFDAVQAKLHQETWAKYLKVPVEYTNTIGMKFRLIPPGEFLMGAPDDADPVHHGDEKPAHRVRITQPYYLGSCETTVGQFRKFVDAIDHKTAAESSGKGGFGVDLQTGKYEQKLEYSWRNPGYPQSDDHPVGNISWNDSAAFNTWLDETQKRRHVLPTEAQWEMACRAGTTSKYYFGDTHALHAKFENIADASLAKMPAAPGFCAGWDDGFAYAAPVGRLLPNGFGLHDMMGNLAEKCRDRYDEKYYRDSPQENPSGPDEPVIANRAHRGSHFGAWGIPTHARYYEFQDNCVGPSGFRVAVEIDWPEASKPASRAQSSTNWPEDTPPPAIAPFNAEQAKQHQEAWAKHLKVPVEYTNNIGMKFRLIPPGEFLMGCSPAELEELLKVAGEDKHRQDLAKSESPRHKVILTQPFFLGVHEVTQGQYEKIVGKNPSALSPGGSEKERVTASDTTNHPVEFVNWNDADRFCTMLSEREQLKPFRFELQSGERKMIPGIGYRLPTEAEWEFSCRAGTTTKYWTGDDGNLTSMAWFFYSAKSVTHPVGALKPNPFGLFDVHGNVWEWVLDGWDGDFYGQFRDQPALNPMHPFVAGSYVVIRGGGWNEIAPNCRASVRYTGDVPVRNNVTGFRVALTADAVQAAIRSQTKPKAKGGTGSF